MTDHPKPERDADILPDKVASRVLARASELDEALRRGASVAELRSAAAEAGITESAFEAALAEVQGELRHVTEVRRSRNPVWAIVVGAAAIVIAGIVMSTTVIPSVAPTRVEQAFVLRCLSPSQASALLRPVVDANTSMMISDRAPGVLTITTTPEQMDAVKSLLDKYEGRGSCAVATPAPQP